MNFIEFAARNVQRNIKAYFAYFLSSTISAALLFSFTMILFHPGFQINILPEYLRNSLYMTTVIAYSFLCFFVFYSISVFLKSRYKEFGILYIIGSSKKQVKKLIFIENMIISLSAAVMGILLGIIFSKILLAASGKLLGYNALDFYIPNSAMIITLSAFMIIGMIISASCSFIIREDKVLSLLKGTKKPRPEPKASAILAIICVGLLAAGYFLSITCTEATIPYRIIPVTIMVVAATYLLFSQLSVFIIKLLKRNRSLYMKKTNVLLISNLLYRVKDNTRMFFLITITTTVALSVIGSVYAYWRDKEDQININFPQAFFFTNTYENKNKVTLKVDFIENSLKNEGIEYKKLSDEVIFIKPEADRENVAVMKEEVYKKISTTLLLDTISFKENETIGFGAFVGNSKRTIVIDNKELQIVRKSNKRVLPTIYGDVYIVKDNIYEKIKGTKAYFGMLNVINFKDTLDICKSYYGNFEKDQGNKLYNNLMKAHILESTKIAYGIILFSAIFIGLIFFVTTGSFLYNKCYMDVIEDKNKYKQLNKIGLTYTEIKKILNIEIGVLFLLPYLVAIIHFSFAISSLKYAFAIKITSPALQVIGIMLIVQIVYFFVIRNSYLIEIRNAL